MIVRADKLCMEYLSKKDGDNIKIKHSEIWCKEYRLDYKLRLCTGLLWLIGVISFCISDIYNDILTNSLETF